jgi:hypothetical protein
MAQGNEVRKMPMSRGKTGRRAAKSAAINAMTTIVPATECRRGRTDSDGSDI